MARRISTNYFTSLANTNEQDFSFATPDDSMQRSIKRVYSNLTSAGILLTLKRQNQILATIDCLRFANGNEPVEIDEVFGPSIQLTVGVTDLAGAAHTNFGVQIVYDVA